MRLLLSLLVVANLLSCRTTSGDAEVKGISNQNAGDGPVDIGNANEGESCGGFVGLICKQGLYCNVQGSPSGGGVCVKEGSGIPGNGGGPIQPAGKGCVIGGVIITMDTKIRAADGCNTCGCSDGSIFCTELACGPNTPKPLGCNVDGVVVGVGEKLKAADGCNACACDASGSLYCTELACGR